MREQQIVVGDNVYIRKRDRIGRVLEIDDSVRGCANIFYRVEIDNTSYWYGLYSLEKKQPQ